MSSAIEQRAIKAQIEQLARDTKCSKGLNCVRTQFKTLCRALDVGLKNNLSCLEAGDAICDFRIDSNVGQFCQCPMRVYIGKTLNR